jgi:hypothetical protein
VKIVTSSAKSMHVARMVLCGSVVDLAELPLAENDGWGIGSETKFGTDRWRKDSKRDEV